MEPWRTTSTRIPNGNGGTRTTLAEMSRLAADGARDPRVIAAAHSLVRSLPERDDVTTMTRMLADVRRRMRYTRDPLDVELVKAPGVLIEESESSPSGKFVGDCDDASVLLAALLGCVGIPSKFVAVPADPSRPGEWSHVYVAARAEDGRWVPLDPIVRDFGVGEEAPSSALSGPRAYFPGGAGMGDVMHGLRATRYGNHQHGRFGMAGLGDDASDLATMRANAYSQGGIPMSAYGSTPAAGSSSSGLDPTLAAILGLTGSVANTYIAAKNPRPQVVYSNGAPAGVVMPSAGMSPTMKTVLIVGGVVVGGMLLLSIMRRR